jgi:hypothetical protein
MAKKIPEAFSVFKKGMTTLDDDIPNKEWMASASKD